MPTQQEFTYNPDLFYIWQALSGVTTVRTLKQFELPDNYYLWQAIVAFVGSSGGFVIKGDIDCSTNPNYPAATQGDIYRVSVEGKIGGASGIPVEVGDLIVAWVTNAGGTQAAVGASWDINQAGLQQIFEISGSNLLFQVTNDLTQTIGNDWTVTTTRNKSETVTGTQTENTVGTWTRTVNTNKYSFIVVGSSGNTTEAIAGTETKNTVGDKTITVATNKYSLAIVAASGNLTESIAGTETKNTVGNLSRTVATNKYILAVTAASGNTSETIAGTSTEIIAVSRTTTVGTTNSCTIISNNTISIGGNDIYGVTGTKTDTIGVKYIITTPFVGINQNNPDVALSIIGQVILQNANNITANSAQVNIYTGSGSFPIGLWARANIANASAWGIIAEALATNTGTNIAVQADVSGGAVNKAIVVPANNPNAGANNWALWLGSNAQNYMEGSLGIGIAVPTQKLDVAGAIRTQSSGAGAGVWMLGTFINGAVTPDTLNYVEVNIDGTIRKLIVAA